MPFLPLQACCLEGAEIPGTPRGVMESPPGNRTIGRYHATPKDGRIVDEKAAVVLYYDAFGFNITNAKILADAFADQLGLNVFVPDYIPYALKPQFVDPIAEHVPGEHANKSWFATIRDVLYLIYKILPYIPSILPGRTTKLCLKAIEELKAEGFEKLGAIGYCLGGTNVSYLLSIPSNPLSCGVLCHPGPDTQYWGTITRPTRWILASHDMRFTDKYVAQLDQHVYPETTHGFAVRPKLTHEPTKKAFDEAGESATEFFRKHLLNGK